MSPEQMTAINGALQNQINGENGRLEESWSELVNTANDSITSAQQALNDAFGALDAAKEPINAALGMLDLEGGVSLTDAYTALDEAQAAMTALAGTDPGELNTAIQALCREVDELKTITDTLYEVLTSHGAIQTYLEKVEKMTGSLDGKIPENFDPGSALQELMDAGTALNKGLHQLEDGTAAFRDGIAELAEDGGWKLRRLTRELDAMHAADLAYSNFGGIADGRSGSVRFIIETDAVEKQA